MIHTTAHTKRRFAALAVVAVLLLAALAGAVAPTAAAPAAMQENTTNTSTPTDTPLNTSTDTPTDTAASTPTETSTATDTPAADGSGEEPETESAGGLTLEELKEPGKKIEGGPDSSRTLGSYGALAIYYDPIGPFTSDKEYLSRGTTLHSNTLVIESYNFGQNAEPKNITIHVAFYKVRTKTTTTENGETTKERVATNVTKQETEITMGVALDKSKVNLAPHYDETYRMSIWATDGDGNQLYNARWTGDLRHRSSQASQAVDIDNESELWAYIGKYVFGIGIFGLLVAFGSGSHVLDRIGRGTGYGVAAYGFLIAFFAFVLSAFMYVQTAAVLSNVPIVWGGLITLVGFVGYVETAGPTDKRVLFGQDELQDAKSPRGESVKDTVYKHIREKIAIDREDGDLGLPADGIRPAIARYFASPATLDDLDLATDIEVRGDFDRMYISDPDSDDVLTHTPARLQWNPTIIEPREDTPAPTGVSGSISDLLGRVNWEFVVGSAVCLGGGWALGAIAIGYPLIGIGVGLLGVVALGYEAKDGKADFEPAPIHYRPARVTIANKAVQYDDAKTIEEADRKAFKAEAKTAAELRDRQADRSKVTSQKLAEETAGVSLDPEEQGDHLNHPDGRRERRKNGSASVAHEGVDEDSDEDEAESESGWKDA